MYLLPLFPGDKEQELTDWDKIKGYQMSNDGYVKLLNAVTVHMSEGPHVRRATCPKVHLSEGPLVRRSTCLKVFMAIG